MNARNARNARKDSFGFSILVLLSSVAWGQPGVVDLFADTGRPVARAVEILESRYPGVVITYEDPPYTYPGDSEDVTEQVRKDLREHAPGEAPRVLVPTSSPFTFSHRVAPDTEEPVDWIEALNAMTDAYEVGAAGGRFSVRRTDNGSFHVVPVEVRDENGLWTTQAPVLDALITLSEPEERGIELLRSIVGAVGEATGEQVVVGTIPLTLFGNYRGTLVARSEPARNVLLRLFAEVTKGTTGRLSWRLLYGPDVKYYALNIHSTNAIEPIYDSIPPVTPSDDDRSPFDVE